MFPFGGGPTGRVGRSRGRMDQMDCADIMMKAVERKRSRSIARRESFSGTDDDLKKFREAVDSNEKDSSLQKELDEYAVKVREIRGTKEVTETENTRYEKTLELLNCCKIQDHTTQCNQNNDIAKKEKGGNIEVIKDIEINSVKEVTLTEDSSKLVSGHTEQNVKESKKVNYLVKKENTDIDNLKENFSNLENIEYIYEEIGETICENLITEQKAAVNITEDVLEGPVTIEEECKIFEEEIKKEDAIENEEEANKYEEEAIKLEEEVIKYEDECDEVQAIWNEDKESTKGDYINHNESMISNQDVIGIVEENESQEEKLSEENQLIENEQEISTDDGDQDNSFLSIVDRIKNDITTLKTLSKTNNQTSSNICEITSEDSRGEKEKTSYSHENIAIKAEANNKSNINLTENQNKTEHKQTGIKVALDRVYREKSVGGDIQVPKELSSHLMTLSSANISEELRKSCSNIVARTMDMDMSKEYLLKRLEELLTQERKQLTDDLKRRKEQLRETRNNQANEIESLDKMHKEELRKMRNSHAQQFSNLECDYLDHAENLKKEIELLENEKDNMAAPADLISTYLVPGQVKQTQVSELEAELECCSCGHICKPPCKIYQCPEGDLLCQKCKEMTESLTTCPRCHSGLVGQVSRNKGLEKIAAKYYM